MKSCAMAAWATPRVCILVRARPPCALAAEMPASRITVNTPTTHGAIGFSTALPPSMTLGCGSWGGNVTSDNVSPLHLLDIKRVAFEVRPVKSKRPAVSAAAATTPAPAPAYRSRRLRRQLNRKQWPDSNRGQDQPRRYRRDSRPVSCGAPTRADRQAKQGRHDRQPAARTSEIGSRSRQHVCRTGREPPATGITAVQEWRAIRRCLRRGFIHAQFRQHRIPQTATRRSTSSVKTTSRRAVQKGEKIYINAKTIITPAARDIGEPAEIFAKGDSSKFQVSSFKD